MNGQSETEQLQNFHERLSQWVSSQGFWFQLRYSMASKGARGALTFHALRMAARILVFVLVVAAGVFWYLLKQTDMESYRARIQTTLKEKLGAEELEMRGLERRQGQFSISRLAMTGEEGSFFSSLEIRNLKCRKTLLDTMRKNWDPGVVSIWRADVDLRAGTDSLESAESIAATYFQDTGGFNLNSIVVNDMSVRWGYSERTRGSIIGSKMRAERLPDGWKLMFRGGTFTQNWLKRLEIEEIEATVTRKGVTFDKALFRKNEGHVSFVGLSVRAGERPEVGGTMRLRKMEISSILPLSVRNFVEGTLSAELRVFGSTNSTEGIGFEGDVALEGEDLLVIRDRIHLLRALSVVDAFNNFRRIDFRKGFFHIKTHAGRLDVTGADLSAGDLFRMKGGLTVRLPTREEALTFSENDPGEAPGGILNDDELEISLERAATLGQGSQGVGFAASGDQSLFDRLGLNVENRRLEEKAAERVARSLRYDGSFEISLPPDVFEKAPKLAEAYPLRDATGRVLMRVPLEGVLYDLTLKQAEEIYEKGAR